MKVDPEEAKRVNELIKAAKSDGQGFGAAVANRRKSADLTALSKNDDLAAELREAAKAKAEEAQRINSAIATGGQRARKMSDPAPKAMFLSSRPPKEARHLRASASGRLQTEEPHASQENTDPLSNAVDYDPLADAVGDESILAHAQKDVDAMTPEPRQRKPSILVSSPEMFAAAEEEAGYMNAITTVIDDDSEDALWLKEALEKASRLTIDAGNAYARLLQGNESLHEESMVKKKKKLSKTSALGQFFGMGEGDKDDEDSFTGNSSFKDSFTRKSFKKSADAIESAAEAAKKAARAAKVAKARQALEAKTAKPRPVRAVVHVKSEQSRQAIRDALARIALFADVSDADIVRLVDAFEERTAATGEIIVKQGDVGNYFYIIISGRYSALIKQWDGTLLNVYGYHLGGSFGELALLYDKPRAATIRCEELGVLFQLDRETFMDIVT